MGEREESDTGRLGMFAALAQTAIEVLDGQIYAHRCDPDHIQGAQCLSTSVPAV